MGENLLLVDTAMEGRTTSNSAKQLLAWWLTHIKSLEGFMQTGKIRNLTVAYIIKCFKVRWLHKRINS